MLASATPSAAPPASVLALPAAALRAQLRLLRYFWSTPKLRAPLLVVWVATLGGSLHAPAVPFFYVEMGLDAPAIGTLNSLSALGSLALAAPYGWLLDKRGPYTAILISSAMCGLGCLFRGLAPSYPYLVVAAIFLGLGGGNLVTLILAYVSTQTEPSQRALVVSGCAQLGARNSFWRIHTFSRPAAHHLPAGTSASSQCSTSWAKRSTLRPTPSSTTASASSRRCCATGSSCRSAPSSASTAWYR